MNTLKDNQSALKNTSEFNLKAHLTLLRDIGIKYCSVFEKYNMSNEKYLYKIFICTTFLGTIQLISYNNFQKRFLIFGL